MLKKVYMRHPWDIRGRISENWTFGGCPICLRNGTRMLGHDWMSYGQSVFTGLLEERLMVKVPSLNFLTKTQALVGQCDVVNFKVFSRIWTIMAP